MDRVLVVKKRKNTSEMAKKVKEPVWMRLKKTEVWVKYNGSNSSVVKKGMAGKFQKMHKELAQKMVDLDAAEIVDKGPTKIEQTKPSNKKVSSKKSEDSKEGSDK